MSQKPDHSEPEEPPIRFTDNRKINRDGAATTAAPAAGPDSTDLEPDAGVEDLDENAQLLEERTKDLQRLHAEYANYRKRAERDRLAAGELAVGRALSELLPVIDDLDRAKAHGDLTGALKAVSDKLEAAVGKLGLVAFGEAGDPFDPSLHEAVLHDESDAVTVPTASTIMRVGYRHGERLLRPAMVGVTDPVHPAPPSETQETSSDATSATEGEAGTQAPPTNQPPADGTPPTQGDPTA